MKSCFIEPVDVLFLRGNRLFGDAGSYGESMVPPWPSTAAGAIRSAILVRDKVSLAAYANGAVRHETLGTPSEPGAFRVLDFQLAWHGYDGSGPLERLYPIPADLVVTTGEVSTDAQNADKPYELHRLKPIPLSNGIGCSIVTPQLPVMSQTQRRKPVTGIWLTEQGWRRWINGELPDARCHLVRSENLWRYDERVGIGLDVAKRRAEDGKLFTAQAIAMRKGVGFAVVVEGDSLAGLPTLRFGGDARAGIVRTTDISQPECDYQAIVSSRRCRVILTSPAIFSDGWSLPGVQADGSFALAGVRGRLVCAAVPRAEVISGWDLADWKPKPAERAVPAGAVYWLEALEATEEQLAALADRGLWPDSALKAQRRVEGYNRFVFATY